MSTSRTRRSCPISGSTACALVTGSTSHEGREPWDGIAELWFDNRAALDAAWSSEIGKIALAHSRESHSDRLVLITEEHELIG
jgi:EthD domain